MRTAKTSHCHRDGLDYRLKLTGNSQGFTGASVERWHYRPFEVPPAFGQIGLKVSLFSMEDRGALQSRPFPVAFMTRHKTRN